MVRIDLPGIEAFLSIANWGSFRRAAGHLNLSQAALSHRLKKLEDDLGIQLLTRTTRRVSLTPAGLELLPVAQRIVQELSSALGGLRERGKTRQERIAIGCLPTVSLLHMPAILTEFHKSRPQTTVQIYDNAASEIAERVRIGEADFGVTILSANSWDLEITPLVKDAFVVACSASHPLAKRPHVQWRDLEGHPLIRISAETGNRSLIDDALGARRETMTWRYEVQRVATAIELARSGMGATIVPKLGFDVASPSGLVTVPLRNPSVARTLGLVMRRGDPLSPAAARLAEIVTARLRKSAGPGAWKPARKASKGSA